MWLWYLNFMFSKWSFLFQLENLFVSNICVLKGLKRSEAHMEKVVFNISVTIFQISPIFFSPQIISHRISIHYVL